MPGAARLACAAAYRAGAGIVHLSGIGLAADHEAPTEVVYRHLPNPGWVGPALADVERFAAVLIGPGIGRGDELVEAVERARAYVHRALVGGAHWSLGRGRGPLDHSPATHTENP